MRHFLDLHAVAPAALRGILDDAARVKAARDGAGGRRPPAWSRRPATRG